MFCQSNGFIALACGALNGSEFESPSLDEENGIEVLKRTPLILWNLYAVLLKLVGDCIVRWVS